MPEAPPSRSYRALITAWALAAIAALLLIASVPTPDLIEAGRRFTPLPAAWVGPIAGVLIVIAAGLTGYVMARFTAGRSTWIRLLLPALAGAPFGYLFGHTFDLFAQMKPIAALFAGGGAFEAAAIALGLLLMLFGGLAIVGTFVAAAGKAGEDLSRRDRSMVMPASGVYLAEGGAILALTALHLRTGDPADAVSYALLAVLAVCVLLDVAFQALTWKSMDEFMRQAWLEAMGLGLILSLALGFIYVGAAAIGIAPSLGLYHAITSFYAIYLTVAFLHAAVRMPEVFSAGTPAKEAA